MGERPSVFQLRHDADGIARALSYLETMGEEVDPKDAALVMERLEEYGEEVEDKMAAIVYVRAELEAIGAKYHAEVKTLQRAIKANGRAIERVKSLGVDLFEAFASLKGDKEGLLLELPNGTKARLLRKEAYFKPVWRKRNEHLLPDEVKKVSVEKRVDKDLLLEWSQTAEMPLDGSGDPVVLIERVDPTHWAVYGKGK